MERCCLQIEYFQFETQSYTGESNIVLHFPDPNEGLILPTEDRKMKRKSGSLINAFFVIIPVSVPLTRRLFYRMIYRIFILSWIFFIDHRHCQKADKNGNTLKNVSQVPAKIIRNDRDISDEQSWDDFPIVHDYFYDNEEGYFEREGHRREYSNGFQPLCHNVRRRIELSSEVYEYHPAHYVETVCRKFSSSGTEEFSRTSFNQMCSQPGFTCVQRTQTVYLTRKRYDSDCWEAAKEVIASGCDCMWPGASFENREILRK